MTSFVVVRAYFLILLRTLTERRLSLKMVGEMISYWITSASALLSKSLIDFDLTG